MENKAKKYVLYFKSDIDGSNEKAIVEITQEKGGTYLSEKDIPSLANSFFKHGWDIDAAPLETINPTIANEWAEKPWDKGSGIEELAKRGPLNMKKYYPFSINNLVEFYAEYTF
ncbi:MAG: hypothetical protein KC516_04180 [Nanoarchaeota archaeon]|nr:hypothetical protein [Nanoarchaeota archaeon]